MPDVAYASWDRFPQGDVRDSPYLRAAPDLAIEIISPGQGPGRLIEKIQYYLLYGVRLIWIVDPAGETVMALAPNAEPHTLTRADTLDGGDVPPGFRVALDDIFAQLQV